MVPVIDLIQEKHYNSKLGFHRYLFSVTTAFESLDKFVLKTKYKNTPNIEISSLKRKIRLILEEETELKKEFFTRTRNWGTNRNDNLINRLELNNETINRVIIDVFSNYDNTFIRKIKSTRDSLAHQGVYKNHFESNVEIILASKTMEFLVKLLIYKASGVDIEIKTNDHENDSLINQANKEIKYIAKINGFVERK